MASMKMSAWSVYLSHSVDIFSGRLLLGFDSFIGHTQDLVLERLYSLIFQFLFFHLLLAKAVVERIEHGLIRMGIGFPELIIPVELVGHSLLTAEFDEMNRGFDVKGEEKPVSQEENELLLEVLVSVEVGFAFSGEVSDEYDLYWLLIRMNVVASSLSLAAKISSDLRSLGLHITRL